MIFRDGYELSVVWDILLVWCGVATFGHKKKRECE